VGYGQVAETPNRYVGDLPSRQQSRRQFQDSWRVLASLVAPPKTLCHANWHILALCKPLSFSANPPC
jgi:hypothetical protein